jgi:hypothetical protein
MDASDATMDPTDEDARNDESFDVEAEATDHDVQDEDALEDAGDAQDEDGPGDGFFQESSDDSGDSGPCGTGACGGSCADCDGVSVNGCETDLSNDPLHCGSCGRGCDGYACQGGACEVRVLVSDAHVPWDLAVDDAAVYWVEEGSSAGDGRVRKVPNSGGFPQSLAETQATPIAIAIDDECVFWVNFTSGGSVSRIAKNGTGYAKLAVANGPRTLAIDTDRVFWTSVEGALVRLPKTGGSPVTITQQGVGVVSLFVFDTDVYWTHRGTGRVLRMNKLDTTGDSISVVASGLLNPTSVYVDANHVFWSEAGASFDGVDCFEAQGRIAKTSRLEPGTVEEIASGQPCPVRITADESQVYWTNQGTVNAETSVYRFDGSVARAPGSSAPGGEETLATAQLRPRGIALSATSVFWVSQGLGSGQGTVARVAK